MFSLCFFQPQTPGLPCRGTCCHLPCSSEPGVRNAVTTGCAVACPPVVSRVATVEDFKPHETVARGRVLDYQRCRVLNRVQGRFYRLQWLSRAMWAEAILAGQETNGAAQQRALPR
eukprot:s334_g19.t1